MQQKRTAVPPLNYQNFQQVNSACRVDKLYEGFLKKYMLQKTFLEAVQNKLALLCHEPAEYTHLCHPDTIQRITCSLVYLQLMQTLVETLKHQSVNHPQEAAMWEFLHTPRLVLEGREGPRGRGSIPLPPEAELKQPTAIPLHYSPGQPCSHDEGSKANTQSSCYIQESSWAGRGWPHRIFNPSSSAQPVRDQLGQGTLKGHCTKASRKL